MDQSYLGPLSRDPVTSQTYLNKPMFPYDQNLDEFSEHMVKHEDDKLDYDNNSLNLSPETSTNPCVLKDSESEILTSKESTELHMCLSEEKLRTKKRFKPEPFNLDIDPKNNYIEKVKLERNRICARECRMRKKEYVKQMEIKIKRLQNEIVECHKELNKYKNREQQSFFNQINMKEVDPNDIDIDMGDQGSPNSKKLLNDYIVWCTLILE